MVIECTDVALAHLFVSIPLQGIWPPSQTPALCSAYLAGQQPRSANLASLEWAEDNMTSAAMVFIQDMLVTLVASNTYCT